MICRHCASITTKYASNTKGNETEVCDRVNHAETRWRLMSTHELSEAIMRLLCGGVTCYSDDVDQECWTYVRSWGGRPGTTEYMEIVSILDSGKTVEAIRVDHYGQPYGSPHRGTPRHVVDRILDFGFSQTASQVLHGGWWWGREISRTNVLHAALPTGAMPETSISLCAKPMKCHGPNRPAEEIPLCPACCVAIVDRVIATPFQRFSVVEEGID